MNEPNTSQEFLLFTLSRIESSKEELPSYQIRENSNLEDAIFFGVGTDLEENISNRSGQIVVFEPCVEKIKFFQNSCPENQFQKVQWIIEVAELEKCAQAFCLKKPAFFCIEIYSLVFTQFKLLITNTSLFLSHHSFIKKIILENSLQNLKRQLFEINGSPLKNQTALIIGAGPSLKEYLHEIQKIQDFVYIFSSLRSAEYLLENGINPDFIGVIDPEEKIDVQQEKIKKIPCFFSLTANAIQLNQCTYPIVSSLTSYEPIVQFLQRLTKLEKPLIDGGHHVCSFLTSTAIQLGCSTIVLYGVDLCYQDQQKYAFLQSVKSKEELIQIQTPNGIKWTQRDFLLSKYWFEQLAMQFSEMTFCNRSNGLDLEGFQTSYYQIERTPKEAIQIVESKQGTKTNFIELKKKLQIVISHFLEKPESTFLFFSDLQDLGLLEDLQKSFLILNQAQVIQKQHEVFYYFEMIKELEKQLP